MYMKMRRLDSHITFPSRAILHISFLVCMCETSTWRLFSSVGGTFDFCFSKNYKKTRRFQTTFQIVIPPKRKKTVLSETLSTSPIGRHWHLMDRQTQEKTLTVDGVPSRITGQLFKFIFSERRRREYDNLPTLKKFASSSKSIIYNFLFFCSLSVRAKNRKNFQQKGKKSLQGTPRNS